MSLELNLIVKGTHNQSTGTLLDSSKENFENVAAIEIDKPFPISIEMSDGKKIPIVIESDPDSPGLPISLEFNEENPLQINSIINNGDNSLSVEISNIPQVVKIDSNESLKIDNGKDSLKIDSNKPIVIDNNKSLKIDNGDKKLATTVIPEGDRLPIETTFKGNMPLSNNKYNLDYFMATIAGNLFSNYDVNRPGDDVTQRIISRARTFGNAVKVAFPGAF